MKPVISVPASLLNIRPATELPLCLTPEAAQSIASSVGSLPPETGAKLFGPMDGLGVDHVEFDKRGSALAGGAVYAPDVEWGSERVEFWLSQDPLKLWSGDVHSHPGDMARPSSKAGPGLGDMGYAEAFFQANEIHQFFLMPIVLPASRCRELPEIAPWIVCRDNPTRPLLAELRICDVEDFPKRIFNPAWEQAKDDERSSALPSVEEFLERMRGAGLPSVIVTTAHGTTFVELPSARRKIRIKIELREERDRIAVAAVQPWNFFGGKARLATKRLFRVAKRFGWRLGNDGR